MPVVDAAAPSGREMFRLLGEACLDRPAKRECWLRWRMTPSETLSKALRIPLLPGVITYLPKTKEVSS